MSEPKLDNSGGALRELRESLGISLRELAQRLSWDRGILSKYENNRLGLSLSRIDDIAGALGLRPEVVILFILKKRYPSLASTSPINLLDQLVEKMEHL